MKLELLTILWLAVWLAILTALFIAGIKLGTLSPGDHRSTETAAGIRHPASGSSIGDTPDRPAANLHPGPEGTPPPSDSYVPESRGRASNLPA